MLLPELKTAYSELIGMPSISSVNPELNLSNRPVVERLANWFADAGFKTEILPVAGRPDQVNLVARIGPVDQADGLVLSGHTDTVPCNPELWQSDPFTLTERDGRWYGLGSADMKGFFALILEALRGIDVGQLQRPLTVLATADEESGMDGAKSLVSAGLELGSYAVIGEPTSLVPVRMHKGILMERIRLLGQSGHSSDPGLGSNALEGMHAVISALLALRNELQARHQHAGFSVPVPTMNFGHICGGDNPNRICGDCELALDLRSLPGMDIPELREQLRQTARQAISERDLKIEFDTLFDGVPAVETAADARLVQYCQQLSGQTAEAVAYCTEAPFLQRMGLETVVFGPGSINQAHQPDEYMDLGQIDPAVGMLRQLVQNFCIADLHS